MWEILNRESQFRFSLFFTVNASGSLAIHNTERAAVGVANLQWSNELAGTACTVALNCDWAHSAFSYRSGLSYTFDTVGENFAVWSANDQSTFRINYLTQLWANEKADYTNTVNPDGVGVCAPDKPCGHYTQMVWSDTTHVGCAITYCPLFSPVAPGPTFTSGAFLVCHYGPTGNYRGELPYPNNP